MKLIFDGIVLSPFEKEEALGEKLNALYGLPENTPFKILRKSLDARDKSRIHFRYRIEAEADEIAAERLLCMSGVSRSIEEKPVVPAIWINKKFRIVIAGSGPAGLFSALRLIEAGATVTVIERGKSVEERMQDIHALKTKGILNPESNVLFGEGGAGTYSDGKLTTRTHRPEISWVFNKLVEMGAPSCILYEQKPHLGTDRLTDIVRNIRRHIMENGTDIRFGEKAVSLMMHDGSAAGVVTESGNEYPADAVILATGHSARDTYKMLTEAGIALEKKGFAVGLRTEHPSALINRMQYGSMADKNILPAAEYVLTFNNKETGRGTYSFCMCPGGEVINSSSEPGMLCINGMSNSKRDGNFSNAAIVVQVKPEDISGNALSGIEFQRRIEKAAFDAGGGGYKAPAQRISSFVAGKIDG